MIVFITNYDAATTANFIAVSPLLPNINSLPLLSQDATAANFNNHVIRKSRDNYFVMTHGNSDKFYDNNNLPAIDTNNSNQFINEKLFVYACYTANDLGKAISANDNLYWGYTGPLSSLVDDNQSISVFQNIFNFILNNVFNNNNEEQIISFINNLKLLCEQGASTIDTIAENDENYDNGVAYLCLNHIWGRLRVYLPHSETPIQHNEAEVGDLFEKW